MKGMKTLPGKLLLHYSHIWKYYYCWDVNLLCGWFIDYTKLKYSAFSWIVLCYTFIISHHHQYRRNVNKIKCYNSSVRHNQIGRPQKEIWIFWKQRTNYNWLALCSLACILFYHLTSQGLYELLGDEGLIHVTIKQQAINVNDYVLLLH